MKKSIALFISISIFIISYSQTPLDSIGLKKLLCKEWVLKNQYPPTVKNATNKQSKTSLFFNPDHTYKSITEGEVDEGKWEIEGGSIKTLKLIEKFTNAVVPINGILIDDKQLVLEFNSSSTKIKLIFEPEK